MRHLKVNKYSLCIMKNHANNKYTIYYIILYNYQISSFLVIKRGHVYRKCGINKN